MKISSLQYEYGARRLDLVLWDALVLQHPGICDQMVKYSITSCVKLSEVMLCRPKRFHKSTRGKNSVGTCRVCTLGSCRVIFHLAQIRTLPV